MEDDQSTTTPIKDEESTIEETSTNEDSQDTDDLDLENDETSFEDLDEDEDTEDSEEPDTDEDSAPESEDETEEESEEDAGEESDSEESPDEEQSPVDEKEQARLAYEARQQAKAEREQREQAKRDAQAQYLQEAEDDKDLAVRQLQIEAYNNRVNNNRSTLENNLQAAVNSIDLFRNGTPRVQNRLLKAVDTFEALHVRKDSNGDPIEVTGNLQQYLQAEAEDIKELLGEAALQVNKQKSSQKARTMQRPVRTPKKAKVDPDVADFDEEASTW